MVKPVFDWKQYWSRWIVTWTALYFAARFLTEPVLADCTPQPVRAGLAFVIAYPLLRWIVRREHYTHTPEGDRDA